MAFMFPTRPAVMGILNITPDSFSDGGQFLDPAAARARAMTMIAEGAAIIDIGAQSTRPDATPISPEDEWARLSPVLDALGDIAVPLSVDTFEPYVAARALACGVTILNDVSGSRENGFPALAAKHGAGLIMMARNAAVVDEIAAYFAWAKEEATAADLPLTSLCLDIGIGFHKDRETDLAAIRELPRLVRLAAPCAVLVGASRKRMIAYCAGDSVPADRLGGSIATHTAAVLGGATVIRAHDVKETVQAIAVAEKLR